MGMLTDDFFLSHLTLLSYRDCCTGNTDRTCTLARYLSLSGCIAGHPKVAGLSTLILGFISQVNITRKLK